MNRSLPNAARRSRRSGVAAIELALFAPLLLFGSIATADLVNSLRLSLRLERTAGELTNIVAQYDVLHPGDFGVIFSLAQRIAGSIDVTQTQGAVIVSGLANVGQGAAVIWQQKVGSGQDGFASRIQLQQTSFSMGASGETVPLAPGNGAVVTEVFAKRDFWSLSRNLWHTMRGSDGPPSGSVMWSFALQRPRLTAVLRLLTS